MGSLLYAADHLGASKAVPFTRKVYENYPSADVESTMYFHSVRNTPNEPGPDSNLFTSTATSKFDPRSLLELRRSVDRWNVDTVHAMSIRAIVGTVLVKRLFVPDLRVLARLAGRIYEGDWWFEAILRRIAPSVDRFIAPSESSRREFVDVGLDPDKIEKQYNFLNVQRFDVCRYDPETVRDHLGVRGRPVVGYVGRLIDLKNVDEILRGFDLLRDTRPDAELLLVGEGAKRNELEALARRLGISERVHFLGFREDVPRIIAACDVGVLASDYESFGMPIVEFLAMERPMVTTNVGVASEIEGARLVSRPRGRAIRDGLDDAIAEGFSGPNRTDLRPFTSEAYFQRIDRLHHRVTS